MPCHASVRISFSHYIQANFLYDVVTFWPGRQSSAGPEKCKICQELRHRLFMFVIRRNRRFEAFNSKSR